MGGSRAGSTPSPAPYRGVEQLGSSSAHNPEVGGSNPLPRNHMDKVGVLNSFLRLSNTPHPYSSGRKLGISGVFFSLAQLGNSYRKDKRRKLGG